MRRALAAILAVWSTLALVAVLAWSHPDTTSTAATQGVPMTVVIRSANGSQQLARVVVLPAGTGSVASTSSSAVAGSAPSTTPAASTAGVLQPASAVQPLVTTRTS